MIKNFRFKNFRLYSNKIINNYNIKVSFKINLKKYN